MKNVIGKLKLSIFLGILCSACLFGQKNEIESSKGLNTQVENLKNFTLPDEWDSCLDFDDINSLDSNWLFQDGFFESLGIPHVERKFYSTSKSSFDRNFNMYIAEYKIRPEDKRQSITVKLVRLDLSHDKMSEEERLTYFKQLYRKKILDFVNGIGVYEGRSLVQGYGDNVIVTSVDPGYKFVYPCDEQFIYIRFAENTPNAEEIAKSIYTRIHKMLGK